MSYNWKSEKTLMLRSLHMSLRMKRKKGWSRDVGARFIAEDIVKIESETAPFNHYLYFTFSWGNQSIKVSELNLRETEEAIKFLEKETLQLIPNEIVPTLTELILQPEMKEILGTERIAEKKPETPNKSTETKTLREHLHTTIGNPARLKTIDEVYTKAIEAFEAWLQEKRQEYETDPDWDRMIVHHYIECIKELLEDLKK